MRARSAGEIAKLVHDYGLPEVRLIGEAMQRVGPGVTIDTRALSPDALFVALPGEHVNGADYTQAAAQAGASAVMVNRPTQAELTHLIVPDAHLGLATLARGLVAEAQHDGLTTMAITGSSGKTSTKDLLAQILETAGPTVSPVGSFNNEIGAPLTACQIDAQTRFLVAEMGARGQGHIAWLCSIVSPMIAAVLNVGTAHLGEFGSQDAIAQAKGEIVEALPADGWAVLNADDPRVDAMAARTPARVARWLVGPSTPTAELVVHATDIHADALQRHSFTLNVIRAGQTSAFPVRLGLMGAHQVANGTAAATMAIAAGLGAEQVADALSRARTRSPMRMELHELPNGAALINDAYNANPESMRAALDTLAGVGAARRVEHPHARTVAILGDMAELGDTAPARHARIGAQLAQLGIDELYALGEFGTDLAAPAAAGGVQTHLIDHDANTSAQAIASNLVLRPGDVVLIKASRVLGLEQVAQAIIEAQQGVDPA